MDVDEVGEFALIERLRRALPAPDARLVAGIGDDAAVWRDGDRYVIATTDTMVAGVHFLPERVSWRDVGWKALATNISDIAAMGGTPSFALVTLSLPRKMDVAHVDNLYAGVAECAACYGVTIAGGDITAAPSFSITIALNGAATVAADGSPLLLRRDGARAGDVIAVTGALGGSAGGLRALLSGDDSALARQLIARHMRPSPRLDAGQAAIACGVRCAIDVSDGLVQDIGQICEASGAGAEVRLDAIPLDEALRRAYPGDAATLAATGGEDYELVLVAPAAAIEAAARRLGTPLPVIGRIALSRQDIALSRQGGVDPGGVTVLDARGDVVRFPQSGWDHLTPARR